MPVFWYVQKKKQRRKILLSCTAFHHLLCMKFVHKIKGTWWSMLISVKQGILIHIIEAWWHGVYVEQVGSQISQWIKTYVERYEGRSSLTFLFSVLRNTCRKPFLCSTWIIGCVFPVCWLRTEFYRILQKIFLCMNIKKTPKNLDFSGFVVFSFVSSLDRKIIV